MSDRVITWNTHKVETGYEFHVYSFGYQMANETLKEGVCATRAKATLRAQKWTRYFKAQARQAA